MDVKNEADKSRWVILALAFFVCWLTFGKIFRKFVHDIWKCLDSIMLDKFQKNYNDRMRSRKEALFFNGLSQIIKDGGRPIHVLEIGAGTGANFAFYPDGTTVTCLEPTTQHHDKLIKSAGHFAQIQFGKLHTGFAEDMAMIESGSIDAVVSTLVLCSVHNIDECLQEIIRVLRPGGKFFFMEHVRAKKSTATYYIQHLVYIPFFYCMGCDMLNKCYENIKAAAFDKVELDIFEAYELLHPTPAMRPIVYFIKPHVSGIATK